MLIRRRREELCHAQDIRRCYDDKRERANELYMELKILLAECEEEKRKAERLVYKISYGVHYFVYLL